MSLNGLDTPQVKEAHDAAVAEPGGWFVLKYAGRDVLEIFGRGNGGIVEIRNAIAQYEDPSPVYGFLRYRRRNVIIKYLPADCSRLVQARVTVHLDSICERFSPYDTVFEIADAKELKDVKLSAACSLHTASGSTSSSTSSLRRRRLMEIAEEEEEQRASKRQSVVNEETDPRPKSPEQAPVALDSGLAASPEESQFSGTGEPPTFVGSQLDRPPSPVNSLENYDRLDAYGSGSLYSSKPKVKLGPRPSLDLNGRQRTGAIGGFRPISALPAGFKTQRKEKPPRVRQSMDEHPHPIVQELFGPAARDPNVVPTRPHTSGGIQPPPIPESKIYVKQPLTPSAASVSSAKSSLAQHPMSPEKSRLKKAMQLREKKKKQQQALQAAADSKAAETGADADADVEVASIDPHDDDHTPSAENVEPKAANPSIAEEARDEEPPNSSPQEGDKPPEVQEDSLNVEHSLEAESAADVAPTNSGGQTPSNQQQSETEAPVAERDPGLAGNTQVNAAAAATKPTDDTASPMTLEGAALSDTHTDSSHPASPLVDPSELGNSTKASSLSEATDETVLDQAQTTKTPEAAGSDTVERSTASADQFEAADEPKVDVVEEANQEAETTPTRGLGRVVNEEETERHTDIQLPVSKFASTVVPSGPRPSVAGGVAEENTISDNERSAAPLHIPQGAAAAPETERLVIPKSKFSTSKQQSEPPSLDTTIVVDNSLGEKLQPEKLASDLAPEKTKQKRQVSIEPIRIDAANLSDDEDLMDELQSATLQEARPMNMSKSPITPVFPTQPLTAPKVVNSDNNDPSPFLTPSQVIPGSPVVDSPPEPSGPATRPTTAVAMDTPLGSGASTPLATPGMRSASNPTARAPLSVLAGLGEGERPSGMRAASSGSAFLNRLGTPSAVRPPSPSPSATSSPGANLLGKKAGVGSSISQRIKALEKLSVAGPPSSPGGAAERPQSTFFAVRHQPSIRGESASRPPWIAERATTLGQDQTPSPPRSRGRDISTATANIRDRSGSITSRLSVFEGGNAPRGRPESVQVTARIVRDPRQAFPRVPEVHTNPEPADEPPLEPKSSVPADDDKKVVDEPLAPEAEAAVAAPAEEPPKKQNILQRRQSKKDKRRSQSEDSGSVVGGGVVGDDADIDGNPRRRSSLTIVRDFIKDRRRSTHVVGKSPSIDNLNSPGPGPSPLTSLSVTLPPSRPPSVHQSTGISSRLSISSPRSSLSRDRETPGPTPVVSPINGAEVSGSGDESAKVGEKKSRASRFIRRLSNSLSSSRKTVTTPIISPTVAEEEYDSDNNGGPFSSARQNPQLLQQPTQLSYMGDVNVQFPDNLLWKRRTMCLDSHGFLILSAAQGVVAATVVNGVKRYHLSDFQLPYAPEMEQQELPNSVCLDFIEGSRLQIACEDRAGQLNTLYALQDAHRSHMTFGQ